MLNHTTEDTARLEMAKPCVTNASVNELPAEDRVEETSLRLSQQERIPPVKQDLRNREAVCSVRHSLGPHVRRACGPVPSQQ